MIQSDQMTSLKNSVVAVVVIILSSARMAAEEVTFEQACDQFNRYQFGNRIERLIEQHGNEEVDRRFGMVCGCYLKVMEDEGYDAMATLTRIVEEDAYFADPTPPWFIEFDERTSDQFKACNMKAS